MCAAHSTGSLRILDCLDIAFGPMGSRRGKADCMCACVVFAPVGWLLPVHAAATRTLRPGEAARQQAHRKAPFVSFPAGSPRI